MIDRSEAADSRLATLANDPIEKAERNDPTLPIDSTDPMDPIDRIEPLELIERIEPVELTDNRDLDMASSSGTSSVEVMDIAQLLIEGFDRIPEVVDGAVRGLDTEDLAFRPDPDANSIAWLVWHLARVQDDHVADVAGIDQVWTAQGWVERFDLPFDASAHGYGHGSADVAAVVASGELLSGYLAAVHAQTVDYLAGLTAADLDRTVDERWDPPVTLAVRLISVLSDDLQHAGQAAYVRGLIDRR